MLNKHGGTPLVLTIHEHGVLLQVYENLGKIGEGTYGIVLKCRHRVSRELVAIKRFRQGEEDEQARNIRKEEVQC